MKKCLRDVLRRSPAFLILLFISSRLFSQITYTNLYTTARTFVNISKPSGGVFDPGDTIEVRYTILVNQSLQPVGGSGAAQIRNILKTAQIIDTLPFNVIYINSSLRILTNEGILYKGFFTENTDADQGEYTVTGPNKIVSIKARPIGLTTDTLHGGTWKWTGAVWQYNNNATPPRFSNNSFGMITYRVRINAAYNQFITFNKASLWFRGIADAVPLSKFKFPQSVIAVFQSPGLCSNGLALSNVFETNGTFGNGKPQNRVTSSPIVPTGAIGYTFVPASANQPNDGFYSIVNNTSEAGSKDTTKNGLFYAPKIFDLFDIFGDHTGAPNQLRGNPPVDTAVAAPGGGYLLLVNASYATNAAITQVINNVCKNTYYEFSAWFRNICPRCAGDSLGNSSTTYAAGWPPNPAYASYAGNDSAGVKPNLAFEINDTTYYTSGNLGYDKTQTTPWKKRGFLFLNNLDSFKITIRNNSPGGGGNDWVMDDVVVGGCVPTLKMNFTPYVLGCSDHGPVVVNFSDTIRYSYNGSYVYYKWQRSINNGTTWNDIAGTTTGPVTPVLVNGQWQYISNYTYLANGATDSGYRFRVIVATTLGNLNSSTCAFTDGSYTYLRLIKCTGILASGLVSFNGALISNKAMLSWSSNNENDFDSYEIEKSIDGINFYKIGIKSCQHLTQIMQYTFTDDEPLNGNAFYRLKMVSNNGLTGYSNSILLTNRQIAFSVNHVTNPFKNQITADYIVPQPGEMMICLYDGFGRLIFNRPILANKGLNSSSLQLPVLSNGIYTLRLTYCNISISKRLMKTD
ncbi:MAG: T9SS type A sorting domain-containing protein [Ferruginibacter sp.]